MSTPHPFYEKPPYVWPNPEVFPFRHYLDHENLRIFILMCIPHNWEWFAKYHKGFRDTDVFLVTQGWWGGLLAHNTAEVFKALDMDKSKFIMICNDQSEVDVYSEIGLPCVLINQNAFLDHDNHMFPMDDVENAYNAIYVGRRSAMKRHMLAAKVDRLAVIAGTNHGNDVAPVPDNLAFINDRHLNTQEVMTEINKAHCGLILSEIEGQCRASSEYLLCGRPVVSTHSKGGRDVWYNDYNSIVCDPDEDAIRDAVDVFVREKRDPHKIRQDHVDMSMMFRGRFVDVLDSLFKEYNVPLDGQTYFDEHFIHMMITSPRMDLPGLFGPPLEI